jgi:hypothetical protein
MMPNSTEFEICGGEMSSPFFWEDLPSTFFYDEESGIWTFQEESSGDTFVLDEILKTGFETVISNIAASLLVLGNVFLALTIVSNRRNHGSLWKSSAMALLYHGIEEVDRGDGDGNRDGSYGTVSQMEDMARGVAIRLEHSEQEGSSHVAED